MLFLFIHLFDFERLITVPSFKIGPHLSFPTGLRLFSWGKMRLQRRRGHGRRCYDLAVSLLNKFSSRLQRCKPRVIKLWPREWNMTKFERSGSLPARKVIKMPKFAILNIRKLSRSLTADKAASETPLRDLRGRVELWKLVPSGRRFWGGFLRFTSLESVNGTPRRLRNEAVMGKRWVMARSRLRQVSGI